MTIRYLRLNTDRTSKFVVMTPCCEVAVFCDGMLPHSDRFPCPNCDRTVTAHFDTMTVSVETTAPPPRIRAGASAAPVETPAKRHFTPIERAAYCAALVGTLFWVGWLLGLL